MVIVALIISFIAFVSAFLAYSRILKISDDIKLQEEAIDEFLSNYNETGSQVIETIANSQEREKKILREVAKLKSVLYREVCNKYGITEEELEKSVE